MICGHYGSFYKLWRLIHFEICRHFCNCKIFRCSSGHDTDDKLSVRTYITSISYIWIPKVLGEKKEALQLLGRLRKEYGTNKMLKLLYSDSHVLIRASGWDDLIMVVAADVPVNGLTRWFLFVSASFNNVTQNVLTGLHELYLKDRK